MCAGLPSEDRDMVVHDFEKASQHFFSVINLKLAYWKQNPWKLLSLAHGTLTIARGHCELAYTIAQLSTSGEERSQQHRLIRILRYPGARLHGEFTQFLEGENDLRKLPLLSQTRDA